MRTHKFNAGEPAYYSIREAAWILGVKPATVSAAIRLGTLRAVRRRSRVMIPASALTRLLAQPTADGGDETR
jgi:excisionase family DNA binding protein